MKIKRYEWLAKQIKTNDFKIGAEIGTGRGVTAKYLLENCPELILYEISYYSFRGFAAARRKAQKLWREKIAQYLDRVVILDGKSMDVYKQVEDESLDFVFIDADHSYKMCLEDIRIWYTKVKYGGLICGHDYQNGRWAGVEKAVCQYFANNHEHNKKIDFMWWHWKKGENEVTKSRSKD